jgi:hypothetical protein
LWLSFPLCCFWRAKVLILMKSNLSLYFPFWIRLLASHIRNFGLWWDHKRFSAILFSSRKFIVLGFTLGPDHQDAFKNYLVKMERNWISFSKSCLH